jgi:hypothetical protein
LYLRNGDVLPGALVGMDSAGLLTWQHPDALQPIRFRLPSAAEILLGPEPQKLPADAVDCRVRLGNEDELDGVLEALDATRLGLRTWYAGAIEIPRGVLLAVTPVPTNLPTIYEGPNGVEGWTSWKVRLPAGEGGEWTYKNGAFFATRSASIARDFKLPDLVSIEFEVTWKGILSLAFALYTDSLKPVNLANKDEEPDFGGFYSLQLNSFGVNLLAVQKNEPLRYLGQQSVPGLNRKNQAHVMICADKSQRTVSLLVDNQVVKQWVEAGAFAGEGTGVRLVHQGQGSVKLSNLRVRHWDGRFDDQPARAVEGTNDVVKLLNGDRVVGAVVHVRDGRVRMQAGGRPVELPLLRVRQLELGARAVRPAGPAELAARLYFHRRGRLTGRIVRWTDERAVIESPLLGRVELNPRVVSRVEFDAGQAAE